MNFQNNDHKHLNFQNNAQEHLNRQNNAQKQCLASLVLTILKTVSSFNQTTPGKIDAQQKYLEIEFLKQ